jgi:glycosyltransferase involved in cell wall biosynthesis
MPHIAAIVPAYNEDSTIGEVVRVLKTSPFLSEVIVVSDGSTDETVFKARQAGAIVYELAQNQGKGEAMRYGVSKTQADTVAFFDADLLGLTAKHVEQLARPVLEGKLAMCVGLRDRGSISRLLGPNLPLISGERVLQKKIIEAIPARFLHGFMVEISINYFCLSRKLAYGAVVLPSLTIRRKCQKVGFWRGFWGYARMTRQVVYAMCAVRIARIFHHF